MKKVRHGFTLTLILICLVVLLALLGIVLTLGTEGSGKLPGLEKVKETDEITFGIDVAKYQGTIDWTEVAASGVDFAMVRLGYRGLVEGS